MAKGEDEHLYADAISNFEEAQIIIFGIPFDGTSSHRSGSAQAPKAIRKESDNFESYLPKYDFDIESVKIHDMGDSKKFSNVNKMVEEVPALIQEAIENNKFLITLGGEHSITIPIVKTLREQYKKDDFAVLILDGHLDSRESYLDEKFSHACVTRRVCELVGKENVASIGVRSFSKEEAAILLENEFRVYISDLVHEHGMEDIIKETLNYFSKKKIYLSIDMDVIDPAFAPGVGNPEYFGLSPWQLREAIELLGPHLIGVDITEVSPPFDNGNTAALAAQLIQIIIAQVVRE